MGNSHVARGRLLLYAFLILIVVGCRPKGVIPTPTVCDVPTPNVFTAAGVDVQFANTTFKQLVIGGINVRTNPTVITLASQAARDAEIKTYLRCLSLKRDGFTHEQVLHVDMLNSFMATSPPPTSEQFIEWQKTNQFPGKQEGKEAKFPNEQIKETVESSLMNTAFYRVDNVTYTVQKLNQVSHILDVEFRANAEIHNSSKGDYWHEVRIFSPFPLWQTWARADGIDLPVRNTEKNDGYYATFSHVMVPPLSSKIMERGGQQSMKLPYRDYDILRLPALSRSITFKVPTALSNTFTVKVIGLFNNNFLSGPEIEKKDTYDSYTWRFAGKALLPYQGFFMMIDEKEGQ